MYWKKVLYSILYFKYINGTNPKPKLLSCKPRRSGQDPVSFSSSDHFSKGSAIGTRGYRSRLIVCSGHSRRHPKATAFLLYTWLARVIYLEEQLNDGQTRLIRRYHGWLGAMETWKGGSVWPKKKLKNSNPYSASNNYEREELVYRMTIDVAPVSSWILLWHTTSQNPRQLIRSWKNAIKEQEHILPFQTYWLQSSRYPSLDLNLPTHVCRVHDWTLQAQTKHCETHASFQDMVVFIWIFLHQRGTDY